MARYTVHVKTSKDPADVFAYMADLTNFVEWDPGVERAEQVEGDGPGPDAVFDLTVKGIGRPLVLSYHTTRYDPPSAVTVRARSSMLTSLDIITVRAAGAGSVVTYDAELTLNGVLGVANPLVGFGFKRIGDRAAEGLIKVLDGEKVADPGR